MIQQLLELGPEGEIVGHQELLSALTVELCEGQTAVEVPIIQLKSVKKTLLTEHRYYLAVISDISFFRSSYLIMMV